MTRYEARINQSSLYTMVVRVDADGQEQVDPSFSARHFSTMAAAKRAADRHIASIG